MGCVGPGPSRSSHEVGNNAGDRLRGGKCLRENQQEEERGLRLPCKSEPEGGREDKARRSACPGALTFKEDCACLLSLSLPGRYWGQGATVKSCGGFIGLQRAWQSEVFPMAVWPVLTGNTGSLSCDWLVHSESSHTYRQVSQTSQAAVPYVFHRPSKIVCSPNS